MLNLSHLDYGNINREKSTHQNDNLIIFFFKRTVSNLKAFLDPK